MNAKPIELLNITSDLRRLRDEPNNKLPERTPPPQPYIPTDPVERARTPKSRDTANAPERYDDKANRSFRAHPRSI